MEATSSAEAVPPQRPAAGSSLTALVAAARPKQWIKNLVLPLPFLFGRALQSFDGWLLAAEGLATFSAVASGIYIVNDVMDRERDRSHPEKRHRPLASGRLSVSTALVAAVALEVVGLATAYLLRADFGRWCSAYAALMIAYSLILKRIPFLEALIVAAGMPLRALAGAALAGVWPSRFLLVCAYLLALFLVAGKRQWEFHHAGVRSSSEHRPALASYGAEGLDYLFIVTGLSTVSAYSAYSVLPETATRYGGHTLAATVPFVVLGLARYVHLVYRRGGGGSPTQALLVDDPWLLVIVMGWVATAGWIIYGR
ncbi:MAG TPA: UbiA prenyltransferase family protein [Thermoanaerobaculia bacterium]|nr:UbiA prenyltransferase family protein [Thermoanaerobaculia bacterium]